MDTIGIALRYLKDRYEEIVICSLDGVGAYDHIRRSSMLSKLADVPELQSLLPFVRMCYTRQSHYLWTDTTGCTHDVAQGERGE